ncbi:HTH_Tnp_Tc3_2 domain-containing protein [Trichonephila clavipes]|nr:HTH_Tnp_Tc3_2 domain-containing protein [Trichonephila clavipes]
MSCKDPSQYEQMSEFERGRIIGLKEADWVNRKIACHMGQEDGTIRRCWQDWVEKSKFQRLDGSDRPRTMADREDRLIVRSAVAAHDSSLSTIRRVAIRQGGHECPP